MAVKAAGIQLTGCQKSLHAVPRLEWWIRPHHPQPWASRREHVAVAIGDSQASILATLDDPEKQLALTLRNGRPDFGSPSPRCKAGGS
ncbi:MAG: hypothetical protein U0V70_19745 [Terriglobia bacterium]